MPADNPPPAPGTPGKEPEHPALAPTISRAPSPSPAADKGAGEITTDQITLTKPPGGRQPGEQLPAASFPIRFGDYELLREIARGGMGVVYLARQQKLNRTVALKMILAGQFASPESVKRFYLEAEAAARLDHPGIVPIYEVGEQDGNHFFSMGFVEGSSLANRLANGPLPAIEAAELMRQVSEAMAFAHAKGVIHRDLKPANVLLDQAGRPKVTDFGLAKNVESDSGLTQTGMTMGTPSYMPPEQACGNFAEIGPLSDVYSLGAMLYCLVTGRPPFQAATITETMRQVQEAEPVAPSQLNPDIPIDLETICLKCLEKEPERRYPSAAILAEELGRFLRSEPILARPISSAARAWRWCQRHRAIASLSAFLLVSLLIGLIGTSSFAWIANGERIRANGEAATAKKKTKETALALEDANDERQRVERKLYSANISGAYRAWQQSDALRSHYHLNQTDESLRGWEHRYLYSLTNPGLVQGRVPHFEIAVCSRSKLLVTALESVVMLRTSSGLVLSTHTESKNRVWCVAISGDGELFASGDQDGFVTIWHSVTGIQVRKQVLPDAVHDINFSPDRHQLFVAGHNARVRIVSVPTLELIDELTEVKGNILCSAFSADGRFIACGGLDRKITLWDWKHKKTVEFVGHRQFIRCVSISPDGQFIVSGADDGELLLWNLKSATLVQRLKGHANEVKCARFNGDSSRIVTGCKDGIVKIWDASSGRNLYTLCGHDDAVTHVDFADEGQWVESTSEDKTFRIWRTATDFEVESVQAAADNHFLAVSPDGLYVAARLSVKEIGLWSTLTGQPVQTLHADMGLTCIAFSPDGQVLASGGFDGSVSLWDASTGKLLRKILAHKVQLSAVAFDSETSQLATAALDGQIHIWNWTTGELLKDLRGHSDVVRRVAFHPSGTELASGSSDEGVRIWDLASGQTRLLFGDCGTVVDYSFDGTRLLTNVDATIQIRDSKSGQVLQRLTGHVSSVTVARFSPDNLRIFSGSWDKSIKIWDAEHGDELLTFQSNLKDVRDLGLSRDQLLLASAEGNGTLRFWWSPPAIQGEHPGFTPDVFHPPLYDYVGWTAPVAYTPDGKLAAQLAADGSIVLRDWRQGEITRRIANDPATLPCITFTPNSEFVLHATSTGHLALCNLQTGADQWVMEDRLQSTLSADFSPDGSWLVTGGIDCVPRVWEAATGKLKFYLRPHARAISAVRFSADGATIFAASHDRTIGVFNAHDGLPELVLQGGSAGINCLAVGRNPQTLASGDANGRIVLWDLKHERQASERAGNSVFDENFRASGRIDIDGHPAPIRTMAFAIDGKRIVSAAADGMRSWLTDSGAACAEYSPLAEPVLDLAMNPTASRMIVGQKKLIREWDPQVLTGSQVLTQRFGYTGHMMGEQDGNLLVAILSDDEEGSVRRIEANGQATDVLKFSKSHRGARFLPDSQRVAITFANEVQLWDLNSGKQVWKQATTSSPSPWVDFSPSGSRFAAMLHNGSVQVWNASSGEPIATIKRKETKFDRMSFAADDNHLLTTTPDNQLQVWEVATGRLLHSFPVGAAVFDLSVDPRTRRVVVACYDHRLRLFDLDTGALRWMASDHNNIPWFVTFSPDGKLVLSGGPDKTVRLFRAETGIQLAVIHGDRSHIDTGAFSLNSERIYSAGPKGNLRVTNLGKMQPLSEVPRKSAD